jgi:release factor glutamine methyltransferase
LEAKLQALPDKPEETATATLRALWQLATGNALSVEAAGETPLPPLNREAELRLRALIAQRIGGVPLAHLTGRQRFMGLELLASGAALIPRRETELVGYAALGVLRELNAGPEPALLVDVCTGSGNLAVALAHHEPRTHVFASDLSAEAVDLARRNAHQLGLDARVEFRVGDLLEPFDEPRFHGGVDLLVCNPPYISSGKVGQMPGEISGYEPRLAFDGGALGVRILQRLIREAPRFLKADGWLAFEVGLGQGPAVLKRLQSQGDFRQHRTVTNAEGEIRAILASR